MEADVTNAMDRQCSELLLALQNIRRDLDAITWLGAARDVVTAHMEAAYELGAQSQSKAAARGQGSLF